MTSLTRYEVMFWGLAGVCALAALAWLVNTIDAWTSRRARRKTRATMADYPVPYALTPAGEDVELGAFREHQNIWPVRDRVGQPGCRGIPCIWFADGSVSQCAAHDPRVRDSWKQWETELAEGSDAG